MTETFCSEFKMWPSRCERERSSLSGLPCFGLLSKRFSTLRTDPGKLCSEVASSVLSSVLRVRVMLDLLAASTAARRGSFMVSSQLPK
eukprot:XP_001709754.1 Hypothetical protein GL50803_32051 [Giardia lamblia ATCC 50803]